MLTAKDLELARNVAGMFRQRVAHGVPDYRIVADELPLAVAIDKLADEVERLTAERTELLAALKLAIDQVAAVFARAAKDSQPAAG